jgi:hypothetical protein
MGSFEHDIEISASMKVGEFVDRKKGWHVLNIICLRGAGNLFNGLAKL